MGHVESVDIEGFKCLKSVSLECGQFNLITGRNGTGKSSVLEAIELGHQPTALSRHEKPPTRLINIESDNSDIKLYKENSAEITNIRNPDDSSKYQAAKNIKYLLEEFFSQTKIALAETELFDFDSEEIDISSLELVHLDNDKNDKSIGVVPIKHNEREIFYILRDDWSDGLGLIRKSENENDVEKSIRISDIPSVVSGSEGEFLANDIEEEQVQFVNPFSSLNKEDTKDSIVQVRVRDFLREHDIFPNLESFSFDELVFDGHEGQYLLPYDFLGDGTKTIIKIVWQLVAGEIPDVVLLEEPENHLHPGYVKELVPFLIDFAREEDVQLFVTSHNVDFISELLSDSLSEDHREWLAEEFRLIQMTNLSPKQFDYDRAKHHTEELHLDLRGL